MKKTMITLMLLTLTSIAWAQDNNVQDSVTVAAQDSVSADIAETQNPRIMELDNQALRQFANKEYNEALATSLEELELIKKDESENYRGQAFLLAFISRCYFRQNSYKKAVEYGLKSAELYGEKCSSDDIQYANLIDNVALYYTCLEDYEKAEKYSDEAVKIHNKYFANDKEMGGVLAHAAEIKFSLGKYTEAVALQEHALSVIENDEGTHSDHYLNELKYMKTYYEKVGNTIKLKEMEELEEQLQEEVEHGYVPPLVEFKTAEKCREHNEDAYYCSLFYLHHYLSNEKMQQAARYIHAWSMASPDVMVYFGEAEAKWAADEKNYGYLIAYLAACTKYALTHDDPIDPEKQYQVAIIDILNYYSANKEISGEVPAFEEYIKLYEKSPDKLYDRIKKDYNKFQKEKDKGNGTVITTREDKE